MADLSATVVLDLQHGPGNGRNSEGSFVTLADGRVLFAYSRYTGDGSGDHDRAVIAARESRDGGRTWDAADRVLVAQEGDMNVMSVSLLRLADGRLVMMYLRKNSPVSCYPCLRVTADEGRSWSEPTRCIPAPGYFVVNNDRLVQLASGRLIIPAAYHRAKLETATFTPGCFDGRATALYFYSDDGGATWQESATWWALPQRSNSGLQEPGVVQRRDGSLLGWARTDTGTQWTQVSHDEGVSWSQPKPADVFPSPCSPLSLKRIPTTGDLLAVWNDTSRRPPQTPAQAKSWGRTPLVTAISRDDGVTWEGHRVIESEPDHGYCYTAIHFVDDAVLLAYCCGGGATSRTLQDSRIRRIPLDLLYG